MNDYLIQSNFITLKCSNYLLIDLYVNDYFKVRYHMRWIRESFWFQAAVKEEPTDSFNPPPADSHTESQDDGAVSEPALPALPVPALPTVELDSESDDQQLEPPVKVPRMSVCPNDLQKKSEQAKPACGALDMLFGDVFISSVVPAKSSTERIESELNCYKEESVLPLNANPLKWWSEKATKYPILSKLACAYLCVQATSVASERVFSTAGDIVSAQRASLTSDNVNTLIFLKKNMKPSDLHGPCDRV